MRGLMVVVAVGALASAADAAPSALDKPAFTATPAELLAAAKAVPAGGGDIVLLREDNDVSYDDRGRITSKWRLVFAITTKQGVSDWDTLQSSWLPAYQDKPTARARVIDSNGRVFDLDPSLITDAPADEGSRPTSTDRRRLEIPLPRLSVGAVIEEQVTTVDREPLLGGGAAYSVDIGGTHPLASMRVKFSSPASKKLRTLAFGLPAGVKAKTETVAGRQVISYVLGPLPALPEYEAYVPGEARPFPYVIASPAASWSSIARDYRALLDKQIAAGAPALPAELPKTASLANASAIIAWLHKQVQYTEVGFVNASYVPAPPADVLKRGYATSIEMATTLVALLRQAGMRADVALIDIGPGPDIDKDLPAINVFDRAIVRARIGKSEVWIDPVERLTKPGVMHVFEQGRFALPISDDTTALVTLPANQPSINTIREVRTFELAETGPSKITEVSREGGVFEAEQRLWARDSAPDELRKNLTDYAKAEYKGELDSFKPSATDDLTKPFEVTLVTTGALRGYTHRENIDIYLFATDTLKKLPDVLGQPDDDAKPRKYDFRNVAPHIYEIENRIVLPVGFAPPSPAPDKTRALGPYKLVEQQRVAGQTLVVTFRFDASKARLKPAEVAAMQQATRELRKEAPLHIVIQHTGHALADQGKFKDAIAETTKLVKLHPKEAVHHLQLAHVLIKAGAGEAARRAARKAVEVEPKNADAYVVLGWMLEHDSFGDWLGFDHDRAGARAAFEKARKLDPKHVGAATELASLLERNARGRRFDTGADVRPAIEVWRAAHTLDPDDDDIAYSLATALLWVGDAGEAEKLLRAMPAAERRDQLLIVAVAMTAGNAAALRTASSLTTSANRTTYLNAAASTLFLMRRYDAMRAMYAELKYGQGNTAPELVMQKVRRDDKPFKAGKNPIDAVVEMALVELEPDRKTNPYWDKLTRDEAHEQQRKLQSALDRNELMTTALFADMLRSGMPLLLEGDAGLWRVELEQGTAKGQVYLAADRGVPKVIGLSERPQGAARHVLRLLAKNDEQNALRLLDWLAKDLRSRVMMDGLAQRFTSVWGGKLSRTRKDMELAAAVLSGTTAPARAIPILSQCKPATSDAQLACDWSLSDLYRETAKWAELEDHARTWATRAPRQLTIPTVAEAYGLAHLGRAEDGEAVIGEALAKDPDNHSLIFVHSDLAIARGDLKAAIARIEPLATKPAPTSSDCNNTAWLKLFEASDLAGAATLGRKAVALAPNEPHAANTLAAIEAELGELGEAKQHLDISVNGNELPRPGDADFYVHARMLEQLGFTDDAIAIYKQIKDKPGTPFTPSSADFASRRLKALGVKK